MHIMRVALVLVFTGFTSIYGTCGENKQDQKILRVALYPYVPGRKEVFYLIQRAFQHDHPGVQVELIEPKKEYYDGGLVELKADVYEIDTILLSEMIKQDKIIQLDFHAKEFFPDAVEAVERDGKYYAIPHWMCGNFLFYRRDDTAIRDAVSWAALEDELTKRKKALFVDFFGRSTLGEWYLTVLSNRMGVKTAQNFILSTQDLNGQALNDLVGMLSKCPIGFCRNKELHDRTGYYARAFVRGEAAAYVGYSESIHYGLQYIIDNCLPGSPCLTADDVAVRRLPTLGTNGLGEGVGWVDGLAVSSELTGAKKELALDFVFYATSVAAYKSVLTPDWMEAPRYLLSARMGVSIPEAPLYSDFQVAHAGRKSGTIAGLSKRLQDVGTKLNCTLPIDRTDTKSAKNCSGM